jgi:uroporphyrin-III C-methyltransferase
MKVSLVGAGPGDADLITLKAIKAIKNADIILYDALANPSLLEYKKQEAEAVFVGKRFGKHSVSQDEINRIIVLNALEGKHVVRLKGGDPVVFGRAFEEIEYVETFGIETEIIPGISSCVAVPSLNRIPVTKRGVADSFWVLTGHTKEGTLPKDMALAAQSSATIIILMGLHKIEEIMNLFSKHGKENTPVAVIQNGSRPDEKMILGEVNSIEKKIIEQGIASPAVIVIGETVKSCPQYLAEYLTSNSIIEKETTWSRN